MVSLCHSTCWATPGRVDDGEVEVLEINALPQRQGDRFASCTGWPAHHVLAFY
jgi:hypothetical protein